MNDKDYRRRLIVCVEVLRQEARMPKLDFYQQIGIVAARRWINFVTSSEEDAWSHFSLKAMERIGQLFGVGAELLQFRS